MKVIINSVDDAKKGAQFTLFQRGASRSGRSMRSIEVTHLIRSLALSCVALVACSKPAPIIADEPARSVAAEDAGADVQPDAAHADAAAIPDASADACVAGETWDVKVRVRRTWHAGAQMNLQGPLELYVPRLGVRKTLFADCGMTGGGCGDCSKPYDPDVVSCMLAPDRAHVDIGLDEVGPTWVDVVARGDTIVAEWTRGGLLGGPGVTPTSTKSTEVLLVLPCAVHVRFVR